ncbi:MULTISPECIES: sulfatase [Achromobacter]|uniref:sulfatase n=1 Tax=Achromobacter TaxID=222 RepID=UPI00257E8E27|nr:MULTISPECIES: sulfatase [Achromobacter]
MTTATPRSRWTFVKEATVISKPDAKITVRQLTLTDSGLRAITSGSSGITQGAREEPGPPAPIKKMVAA